MQPLKIHQIEKIIINDAKNNATGEMHAKLNTYEKVRMVYLNRPLHMIKVLNPNFNY